MHHLSTALKTFAGLTALLIVLGSCNSAPDAATPPGAANLHALANTAHYVDAVDGNDANSGTSPSSPWKSLAKVNATTFGPGDRILFRAGRAWSGGLYPKGSGVSGNLITIDLYGGTVKPILNGGGTVGATVYLFNQQYWQIRNLEITNTGASAATRLGVSVAAQDAGTLNSIYLNNLVVHDVKGDNADKETGGIGINVWGSRTPTTFNDVRIENNTVYKVDRSGIFTYSDWWCRNFNGVQPFGCTGAYHPMTGVVVRNNSVYDVAGDGIRLRETKAPLVEYNVVRDANARAGSHNAGIWSWNSDDSLFQYNEAYLTRTTLDGQGFDVDYLQNGTVFQYNYSHDNEGGFMLVATNSADAPRTTTNSVIRYNISQNDRARVFQFSGNSVGTKIYNNTVYIGPGLATTLYEFTDWNGGWATGVSSQNNIFYNLGSGDYNFGGGTNLSFEANVFYGNHPSREPNDARKLTSDPKLVSPGGGGTGRGSVDGYKLQVGSPATDSGVTIAGSGGRDYWGNAVPQGAATDRGAYEGAGVAATANLLTNPGFESNFAGWTNWWDTGVNASSVQYIDTNAPRSGANFVSHWGTSAYKQSSYQVRTGLASGTYTLSAWIKTSGGQNATILYAKNFGGGTLEKAIPTAANGTWGQYTLPGITVTNGQVEVGVWSDAPAGTHWLGADDFSLTRN